MNYGKTCVYGVSLSYIMANGERNFSYYEIPADSEYEAIQYVRGSLRARCKRSTFVH